MVVTEMTTAWEREQEDYIRQNTFIRRTKKSSAKSSLAAYTEPNLPFCNGQDWR